MGVYIKGMEMPKACEFCFIVGECENKHYVLVKDGADYIPRRVKENCPLVDVPEPHGRLIDADALANDLDYDAEHYEEDHEMKSNCASWLRSNATPTVIEAEGE